MRTPKTRDPRSRCRWPRFPSAPTPVRVTVEAPPGPSAELARLRRGRATRPAGQEAPRRLQRHLPPWAGRGPGRMPSSRRPADWAVCQRRAGMLACSGAPARGALGRARRERGRVSPALAHASRTAPHRQAPRCGSRASDQSDRGEAGGTVAVQGAQRSEAGGACGFWPRAGRGCKASHVSGARRVALAQQPWPRLGRLGRAGRAPPPAAAALRDLRWSPVAG